MHTRRRTITTKLSVDKCLLMSMSKFNGLHICNSIACYGTRYICKCKRHDKVRYECITNGLLGTLATERISSVRLFGLFTTTMGRLTHCMATEHIR